jgi:hypothetical protein
MKRLRSLIKEEQGTVMVMVAASMVALIGLSGIVTDMGMIYFEKSNLKKEATTAVLSAAQELANYNPSTLAQDEQRVKDVVATTLSSYNDGSQLEDLQIEMNNKVTVRLGKNVPYSFSRLFGLTGKLVEEEATATIEPVGKVGGVVPLGIDESTPISYGQVTTLKVGAGDSTTGNFGIFALEGNGASVYLTTLENGTVSPISVGDTFNIKSGNVSGDTSKGVQYRINESPYPEGETFHRDDPRILPVIVYKPLPSKQIEVEGFAYFYLMTPGTDTSVINGMFIKRVASGSYGPGSVDRGAYIAKLVE